MPPNRTPSDGHAPPSPAEAPIIRMPEDKKVFLEAKLGEYQVRLRRFEAEAALEPSDPDAVFQAPEEHLKKSLEKSIGTRYKMALIQELFKGGEVNTHELGRRLAKEHRVFFVDRFNNACGVIKAYCEGRDQGIQR